MINPIIDEQYIDLIVENQLLYMYPDQPNTYINNKYSMIHIKIEELDLCMLGNYPYHAFPSCFTIEANLDLDESGVSKVQNNPYLALFGKGVLIGIIDTGIEYTHEAFRFPDGTSKIAAIWDQTIINDARIPLGFQYGAEYSKTDIDLALKSEDPLQIVPTTDEIGHGTILAGIAAGSSVPSAEFTGVATMSELVIVKCKDAKKFNRDIFLINNDAICYQETDLMLGIRYLVSTAARLGKPISICLGIGTSQGAHDTLGILSTYTSDVSKIPGNCVTLSAGNEGNKKRHYYGSLASTQSFTDIELKIGEKDRGLSLEIWQYSPHRLAIDLLTPTGERSEIIYPKISSCRMFKYVFQESAIWINNNLIEVQTGDQVIIIRFQNPMVGIWKIRIYNMDTANLFFHAWLPSGGLLSDETFFLESNLFTTITSPGNSMEPIVVTAYNSEDGSIFINASRGYTRDGIIKPDLAAPGVRIRAPSSGNRYTSASGTGVASAFTAGVAAMMLEWAIVKGNYTPINGNDLRKIMIRGAITEPDLLYPNETWGYGKLNIYSMLQKLTF